MEPRQEPKREPKALEIRRQQPKPRLRIVPLEQRIAPKLALNHNEALVRQPAQAKPKAAQPRKGAKKSRFQIVPLEQRIAPGINLGNHNETLVRERPAQAG